MKPTPGAALLIGVNGIHVRGKYLYFTNSNTVSIFRVRISAAGRPVRNAKVELVANLSSVATFLDDFTFSAKGDIYVATNLDNSVLRVDTKTGKAKTVVGKSTELTVAGSTAVAFGRTEKDRHTFYVSTSGAAASPVNGTLTEGGKVVAVASHESGW
ncbi:hypothetical protein G7046_g894 [Stylonectria norvegica]|nr:hypothetical protein G7046_g894 [Stylonectria norvegica]